jgi:hypothetical protein
MILEELKKPAVKRANPKTIDQLFIFSINNLQIFKSSLLLPLSADCGAHLPPACIAFA